MAHNYENNSVMFLTLYQLASIYDVFSSLYSYNRISLYILCAFVKL